MKIKTSKKVILSRAIQNTIIIAVVILTLLITEKLIINKYVLLSAKALAWLFIILAFIDALFYIPLVYKKNFLKIEKNQIKIRKGLFIKTITSIPISKIYMVKQSIGPIEKFFHLESVSFVTLADEITMSAIQEDVAQHCADIVTLKIHKDSETNEK